MQRTLVAAIMVACAVAASAAWAEPPHVRGHVVDASGRPLGGARVYITPSTHHELELTTGADGAFDTAVPVAGPCSVVVVYGNASAVQQINVRPDRQVTLALRLDVQVEPVTGEPSPPIRTPDPSGNQSEVEPARISGRVEDMLGNPFQGARVAVVSSTRREVIAFTSPEGRFEATVREPGRQTVVVTFRGASTVRQVTVEPGATLSLDLELEIAADGSEVIEVHGTPPPPPVKPEPMFNVHRAPPYSDRAVLSATWTRAWLLLDIDERGVVQRFKFLKRPGLDLEDIAAKQAFAMTFTPARDADGKPVRSLFVWDLEWPAYDWLLATTGVTTYIPSTGAVDCFGSGPLRLGKLLPTTYRDCSRPDLARAAKVPWIERR